MAAAVPAAIARRCGDQDAPVVALIRGAAREISKYGIVEVKAVRPRLYQLDRDGRKAARREGAERLRDYGPLRPHAGHFPLLADGEPGAGGEIQLTDALLALSAAAQALTVTSSRASVTTLATGSASSPRKLATA